jgi:nicotinamidase/pyrazinamidase
VGNDSALIIVDMQNDFCPGGALAVAGGDAIVPVINRYIGLFLEGGLPIIASRDWHPRETRHFKEFGGIWPAHCVKGSFGARFRAGLLLPTGTRVFHKGTDPDRDDYSALQGRDDSGRAMADYLKEEGIKNLFVCGLATDYCVLETVLEGMRLGFSVMVLADAVSGVDAKPGDSERAIAEMVSSGAVLFTIDDLLKSDGSPP